MSKAVLVMDMPESCNKCMFEQVSQDSELFPEGETYCCVMIESVNECSTGGTKPYNCPLRELPEKMEVCGTYNTDYYAKGGKPPSYKVGWNACIDAITGDSHEPSDNT